MALLIGVGLKQETQKKRRRRHSFKRRDDGRGLTGRLFGGGANLLSTDVTLRTRRCASVDDGARRPDAAGRKSNRHDLGSLGWLPIFIMG